MKADAAASVPRTPSAPAGLPARAAQVSPPGTPPALSPSAPPKPASAASAGAAWYCAAAALAALAALHAPTLGAMLELWLRSPTFAHGLLIMPLAAWLVWRKRARLAATPRRPAWWALWPLAALGALWLLAAVANVQVVQQYCVVAMVAATVIVVLGTRQARVIAFPLAYLLLAVPFGEIFVPPLMEFTSRFTVGALQLSSIPVFRENNYLVLPSGTWSVVEACSGLRYVIASVALGTLYAYLTYRRLARRLAFIAMALVLPVLANGVRAWGIILIGHYSDMRLAVGVDHLVYGWLFFGLVCLLLFWTGARWRESPGVPSAGTPRFSQPDASGHASSRFPVSRFGAAALAAVAVMALWPVAAALILRDADHGGSGGHAAPEPRLTLAPPPAPWRGRQPLARDWQAQHAGQPQRAVAVYTDGGREVSLQLSWYRHQRRDAELLTPVHAEPVHGLPLWHEISSVRRDVVLGGRTLAVRETVLQTGAVKLLVWRWYRQGGIDTGSPQMLKLLLARAKLTGGDDSGAEIAIASSYDEQAGQAAAAMHALLAAMLPAIDESLRHVAGR